MLSNLIGNFPEGREKIVNVGLFDIIYQILNEDKVNEEVVQSGVSFMKNCCIPINQLHNSTVIKK